MAEAIAPTRDAARLASELEEFLRGLGSALVAYSGGVDSTVVLKAAANALGPKALGVLADTESNMAEEVEEARQLAAEHGMPLEVVAYSEIAIEHYAENPVNRCFFCKSELYGRLSSMAADRGFDAVCDGSNADDGGDYRPGLKAVESHRVRSPLRECGATKDDVRALARHYGLPNRDKPSSPCLSSRIPYGQRVTKEKLDRVGQAEKFLRSLGLREVRCRHHEHTARIEARPEDFGILLAEREAVVHALRSLGFHWVSLDLGGFQSGSLNRVVAGNGRETHTSPGSPQE